MSDEQINASAVNLILHHDNINITGYVISVISTNYSEVHEVNSSVANYVLGGIRPETNYFIEVRAFEFLLGAPESIIVRISGMYTKVDLLDN